MYNTTGWYDPAPLLDPEASSSFETLSPDQGLLAPMSNVGPSQAKPGAPGLPLQRQGSLGMSRLSISSARSSHIVGQDAELIITGLQGHQDGAITGLPIDGGSSAFATTLPSSSTDVMPFGLEDPGNLADFANNLSFLPTEDDLTAPVCAPLQSPFSLTLSQIANQTMHEPSETGLLVPFLHLPLAPINTDQRRFFPRFSKEDGSPVSSSSPKRRAEPAADAEPSPKRWGSGTYIPAFFGPGPRAMPEPVPVASGRQSSTSRAPRTSSSSRNDQQPSSSAAPTTSRTSSYRGVSRHRLTKRWEASLWLNGRQLYLGGFNSQEDAAAAYDLAALACKGPGAVTNHPPEIYDEQLKEIAGLTRDEVVAYVRRRSSAFSRGKSKYRGVSGHNGRWEARIGSFGGRKNVSFGIFESEDEAARQYDRALILEKGRAAKTNFPLQEYEREVAEHETQAACRESESWSRGMESHPSEEKRRINGEALRRSLRRD